MAKAKSTKKKTGKSSKASKGKSRGKSEEAAYGLPSDEELEKEAEALAEKKKDSPWDGRSRISTKQYKENYNEIFKKKKTITKNILKPTDSPKKSSLGTNIQINAEIVNGTCPHCREKTVLVSLWTNYGKYGLLYWNNTFNHQ